MTTTNVLDGLLSRIGDPALREALVGEVGVLRATKSFGLVFERHFPENVRLYAHPVKRGVRVQRRDDAEDFRTWRVTKTVNGRATLVDADGAEHTDRVADLVVVK